MLSIVAAMSKNRVIGKNHHIPWQEKLPSDLVRFRDLTLHHTMIMGLRTFKEFKEPLPERNHVVLTKTIPPGHFHHVSFVTSLQEALAFDRPREEVFVIGGGSVFEQCLPFVNKMYLTLVDIHLSGDTYFPRFDMSEWTEVRREAHRAGGEDAYDFVFVDLVRKSYQ